MNRKPIKGWEKWVHHRLEPVLRWCFNFFLIRKLRRRWKRARQSWLLKFFETIFHFLGLISPPNFYRRRVLLRRRLRDRQRWSRNRYNCVDGYVLVCLIIELASLLSTSKGLPTWHPVLIVLLLTWRLLDILQSWFNQYIFDFRPELALSAARTLLLNLIALGETALIFGVFQFMSSASFRNNLGESIPSKVKAVYNSVGIITTMGPAYNPVDGIGYLLLFAEVAMGVIFLVVIVQLVLEHFSRR